MTTHKSLQLPPWPPQDPAVGKSLQTCFDSGEWGKYDSSLPAELESRLAQMCQTDHAKLVGSGAVAIELALRAGRVGLGDEVVIAAYDFPGNFRSIECVGAIPVLVDCAQDSFVIEARSLAAVSSDKVKAVIASHLHGHIAELSSIAQVCQERGWCLIEDACQSIGMSIHEKPVGSFADLATFSFGGSKLVSAGCGGAIVTNDSILAARLEAITRRPGHVYPMSPLQVAVALPQLEQLGAMNRKRVSGVQFVIDRIAPQTEQWQWLPCPADQAIPCQPAYYKLAFLAKDAAQRARVIDSARRVGLPIGGGFRAMHQSSQRRCRRPFELPNSKRFSEQLLVLDHRALVIPHDDHALLGEALLRVYDETAS